MVEGRDSHVKASLPSVPWATEILWLKQEWLACKSWKNTSVILSQRLAGHLGHQESVYVAILDKRLLSVDSLTDLLPLLAL